MSSSRFSRRTEVFMASIEPDLISYMRVLDGELVEVSQIGPFIEFRKFTGGLLILLVA